MKQILSIFLFLSVSVFCQTANGIKQDTSYTLFSAAKKMYKKFPEARLVMPTAREGITEVNDLIYTAINNRKLHLNIYYPKNSTNKLPGVILIHGGGWRSGDRGLTVPMAQKLAGNGYVTISIEYRLSTEAHYPAAVYDIKSAVRWLRANAKKYSIDTNRIAIYGCSAGGQLAALVGTTNKDKTFEGNEGNLDHSSSVQAIIDIDGVVDFFGKGTEELSKPTGKPPAAQLWFGVSAEENPEMWRKASPINHLDENDPPILFINSDVPRFHAGQEAMIEKLKSFNIYYETYTLTGTIHTFWLFEPWFDRTFNYTINFLDKVFQRSY